MDGTAAVHDAYQAYYRRLVGAVYTLTRDLAEAQDVVHEAFARALAHPARFVEVRDPQAWLLTVAMNMARNRYRRHRSPSAATPSCSETTTRSGCPPTAAPGRPPLPRGSGRSALATETGLCPR
ncbi:RNA polymerase sigma factor [Phytohabitans sp. LJ34]|uniref:RNA polymerase sigma factor n=1 Tax=Phytohabitans sp. LJ34 TaxID=3452217 RepID=UPI003F8C47BB